MANAIYPEFKEALYSGTSNTSMNVNTTTDGVYVILTDNTYSYTSGMVFLNETTPVLGPIFAQAGDPQRIVNPTVANGTFDGDNVVVPLVSAGYTIPALTFYRHNSGLSTTWRVIAHMDTGITGFPFVTNGGDISIAWHASGIFTI